jgi:hypothetical protein
LDPLAAFVFNPSTRRFGLEVDGLERTLPALSGRAFGLWQQEFGHVHARSASDRRHGAALDGLVDALVAYDLTDSIGGREWIRVHLDEAQLVSILERIAAVHR